MIQHHYPGEEAEDADAQLQAPQRRGKEDTDDPLDALDKQEEAKDLTQKKSSSRSLKSTVPHI